MAIEYGIDFINTSHVTTDINNVNLDQRTGIFSRQRLTMFDDKLLIRAHTIGKSTENSLLFTEIAPNPIRIKQVAWAWFAISFLAIVASVIGLIVGINGSRSDAPGCYAIAIICFVPFALSLYGALKRTANVILFPSARGNIVIRYQKPTPEACREFVQTLQKRIADSRNVEARIIRNVLQVLRQEEFLDDWKYAKARDRFNLREDV